MHFITRTIVTAALALCAIQGFASATDVDLTTADGVKLKATYMSPGRPGPAMLLVHQCNMDRKSWQSIATQLTDSGVHVLTLDLRGFGESEGTGMRGEGGFGGFLAKSSADVDMAYDYLVNQSGVDGSRVAVGGASCGAMLTADLASRRDGIQALMLLSGPPSENAVAHMAATHRILRYLQQPQAMIRSPPGVGDKLKVAVGGSKNASSTAKVYAGTEHGLPMFGPNADLEPALVAWLKKELLGR